MRKRFNSTRNDTTLGEKIAVAIGLLFAVLIIVGGLFFWSIVR
jgi:hypothetical protein